MDIAESKPEDYLLPARWQALALPLAAVGVVLVIISWGVFYASNAGEDGQQFAVFCRSYLANFMYILSFGIGGMFLTLISFLTRAGWSASIRRMAELLSVTIPWVALLFIPILLTLVLPGGVAIYEWNTAKPEGLIAGKSGYLNMMFFTIRSLLYFGIWSMITLWYYRLSVRQDETKDIESTLARQKWSGPAVMLFALTVSFAAWDWIMSVDADWYSTIFGVYYFSGSMFGVFAFMIIAFMMLQKAGKLRKSVNIEHYHDMAKFQFGFIMFWSYIAFSQLLLYWYGNIPEETVWYRFRWENDWYIFSYALIALHFAIPLLGMLSRHVRRNYFGLTFWMTWALIVHWMDLTFLVMPTISSFNAPMMIGHAVGGLGMFMIFLGIVLLRSSNVSLVAKGDPRLHEALSYANPLL